MKVSFAIFAMLTVLFCGIGTAKKYYVEDLLRLKMKQFCDDEDGAFLKKIINAKRMANKMKGFKSA